MDTYFLEDIERNMLSVHFPSILELMDYRPRWGNHNDSNYNMYLKRSGNGRKWFGPTCRSGDDVVSGAMLGDQILYKNHMAKMVERLRQRLGQYAADYKQVIKAARRKPAYGEMGDEIDIHKVYQGHLDTAWRTTTRIEMAKETKLVTLFIQIAGLAEVDATASLWRAAVAVLLMEDLLAAGKSVKIVVGGYSRYVTNDGHDMTVSITVKEYNEHLSLERLAAMSHLGFYRTFGFAAKCCQPYGVTDGLGRTDELIEKNMPIHFREDVRKGHAKFVVLDRAQSEEAALRSVKKAQDKMKEFHNET